MADIYPIAYLRDKFLPFKEANLSIASSPMIYGLASYTVIPVYKDSKSGKLNIFRLSDHFNRLSNSAKILSFDDFLNTWDEDKLQKLIAELLKKNQVSGSALVRITIFVDGILAGTKMIDIPHKLAVFVYDMQPILPTSGAKVLISSWRRTSDNAIPARAKVNGSYVNASLMKNEALTKGYDEAIGLDEAGHVTESTVSNVFIVKNGQLITPSSDSDLLEGITRDAVMAIAKELNISTLAKTIDRTELYIADEAFLSGSSVHITPIIAIDNRTISGGRIGPITTKIRDRYSKYVTGQLPDKYHWLTKV